MKTDAQVVTHRRILELDEELFLCRLKELEIDADTTLTTSEKNKAKADAAKASKSAELRLQAVKKMRHEMGE